MNVQYPPYYVYGSQTWTLKEEVKARITEVEMKFLRKTANYTLYDHKRNQDIIQELKKEPVLGKVDNYKSKWV
jgi:hypothetical protein